MPHNKNSRKEFLKQVSLVSFGLVLLDDIVFSKHLNAESLAFMQQGGGLTGIGKSTGLTILNDRPWSIETPAHLLDDPITPVDKFFVRNNGLPPENIDPLRWSLRIEGESVIQPITLTLARLKNNFKHYTYQLTLECGGNGRYEFDPPAKGNQWTVGGVGCPSWTGVRLRDVLEKVGIKNDAVYIGYYGKDTHLSGDANEVVISRGVPMKKALEDESLIAWSMNGQDLPYLHGFPLRLVFGGWPASASGKWLHKIVVRNKIHDGPKMGGDAYRLPCEPVEPGSTVPDEKMCIIESMPVKSVITHPKSGAMVSIGKEIEIRGHAWAGDLKVQGVEISFDFGRTWLACQLEAPANRLAWQHWKYRLLLQKKGYYEIWARARDEKGNFQPMVVPGWNPKGYANNACHRIAVKIL